MAQPLDINPPESQQPIIDLSAADEPQTLPVTPQIASSRAAKADFGLSAATGIRYPEIRDAISSGNEQGFRNQAAAKVDDTKKKNVANGTEDPASLLQRTDPKSVIENQYAAEWVKRMYNIDNPWNNNTYVHDAQRDIPEHVRLTAQTGSKIISIAQQLNSAAEEMEALQRQQGWGMYLTQQAAGMVPFVSTLTEATQVPGTDFQMQDLLLPGHMIDRQTDAIYNMDPWDASAAIAKMKEDLKKNPGFAASFFRKLAGQSYTDRTLNDTLGFMDVASVAGMGASVASKAKLFNRVRGSMRDSIAEAARTTGVQDPALDPNVANWENEGGAIGREPVSTAAARGRGDLSTAAVDSVSQDIIDQLRDMPASEARAIKSLLSTHRYDINELEQDPRIGVSERELATRLADAIQRRDLNIIRAFRNALRPNRTPIAEENADVLRVAEEHIRNDFKGVNNQIGDIKTHYDPMTNTYEHEVQIMDNNGKLFADDESAIENARINGFGLDTDGVRPSRRAQLIKNISEAQAAIERLAVTEGTQSPLSQIPGLEANIAAWQKEIEQPPKEGYRLRNQGHGTYIEYTKPFKEWVPAKNEKGQDLGYDVPVNEAFQTQFNRKPWSIFDWWRTSAFQRKYAKGETPYLKDSGILNKMRMFAGFLRTGEETLAVETSEQRGIAAHVTNVFKQQAGLLLGEMEHAVPRHAWNDFVSILEQSQHEPDPVDGVPGYTWRTLPELNHAYMTHLHRLPSEGEVQGYFAWAHANDLDLLMRRINSYIPKAIRGGEQFQFSFPGAEGRQVSGFFEGIERKGVPGGDDNILIVGPGPNTHRSFKPNDARFIRQRNALTKLVDKGEMKIIEIIDPDKMPMSALGNTDLIRYVAVKGGLERKPLSLTEQVGRRGGGHIIPDYDHYAIQPHVHTDRVGSTNRHILLGSKTLMPFESRVTGQQIIDKINRILPLMRKVGGKFPDMTAARTQFAAEHLPFSWNEFSSWFRQTRDTKTGKLVPARLDPEQKFYLASKQQKDGRVQDIKDVIGTDLQDKYGHTFVDGTRSGSIAKTISVEFTQERDLHQLMTINDVGSRKNPIYNYQPAKFVSPIAAQNRGLARIINSTIMNDVKIHSMNKWLSDAMPWLKDPAHKVWHSPYTAFHDAEQQSAFRPGTPLHIRRALMANHAITMRFLGTPSKSDTFLHSMAQELADTIHGIAGPRLVPRWLLGKAKDPIPAIRSLVYSVDMGLGSVKQFFTQWTTHTNVYGMSPQAAPAATLASVYLHPYAYFNSSPAMLAELDKRATMMGLPGTHRFRPGQFLEARDLAINSGFLSIDEEHALARDNPLSAKIIQSGKQKILDYGRMPFTLGAKSVRTTALYSAYLEFRAKVPNGALTRANKAEILNRARLLDHNMSRASNSLLHTGWMSVPGQFWAYDLRLAEILTGKRISPQQKARLFMTSAVAYGIPSAVGLSGYPIVKQVLKYADDQYGYVPGAGNKVMDFMMNGVPSALINSVTGHSYDVAKFGSKGLDIFDELTGDVSLLKIALGATGSALSSAWMNSSHLYKSIMPEFMGGVKDMNFKAQYMLDAMRTLASSNELLYKLPAAINTGKWLSNNGSSLADNISIPNALFMALSGVPENRFKMKYLEDEIMRNQTSMQNEAIRLATEDFHRYLEMSAAGSDESSANEYKENAYALLRSGGVPESQWGEVTERMLRGYESTIRETNERYLKRAPEDKFDMRLEQFKTKQNRDLDLPDNN